MLLKGAAWQVVLLKGAAGRLHESVSKGTRESTDEEVKKMKRLEDCQQKQSSRLRESTKQRLVLWSTGRSWVLKRLGEPGDEAGRQRN